MTFTVECPFCGVGAEVEAPTTGDELQRFLEERALRLALHFVVDHKATERYTPQAILDALVSTWAQQRVLLIERCVALRDS